MTTNSTENFCAICRDSKVACDFITRCGHNFHYNCLWIKHGLIINESPCPICRQTISRSKEKEKLLWGIKKAKFDEKKSEEISKFLDVIVETSAVTESSANIPSYGNEMIENLIQIGWDINSKAEGSLKLLKKICERDDLYRLNLLLENGLKLDLASEYEKEASSTATKHQSNLILEKIKSTVALKVFNQFQSLALKNDKSDQLIEACSNNNFEKVKALVEKDGVNVNCKDPRGARPIHKACASAHIQIIDYLIVKGAEINCIDLSDRSPLYEACTSKYDRKHVVKKLLELDARVDYLDQDNNTLLHVTIISRKFEIAEMLVAYYEKANITNNFKESLLHLAADYGPKSLVEKLIELGCEVNAKDDNEKTPLHRAVTSNSSDVVDLLLEKGANVNELDQNKETPILMAVKRASGLPFVTSLIKHGADLNLKNPKGKTALEIYMAAHV